MLHRFGSARALYTARRSYRFASCAQEASSFFREQAERCRRQARDSADAILQITFGTLADDCTAYADELEDQELATNYPDEGWVPSNRKPRRGQRYERFFLECC
jgi:hypothetical protein